MVRNYMIRYGKAWYHTFMVRTWYQNCTIPGMSRYDVIRYDTIRYSSVISCLMVRNDMICYRMILYDMIRFNTWYLVHRSVTSDTIPGMSRYASYLMVGGRVDGRDVSQPQSLLDGHCMIAWYRDSTRERGLHNINVININNVYLVFNIRYIIHSMYIPGAALCALAEYRFRVNTINDCSVPGILLI